MKEKLDDLVLAWRSAASDEARTAAEAVLIELAWKLAEKAALFVGVPPDGAPDVAQDVSKRLVQLLREDDPIRGSTESLVWVMAENRGRDWHRSQKRQREGRERLAQNDIEEVPESPESIWLDRERRRLVGSHVRALLESAPANYAKALRLHYFDDLPIESIVDRYVLEDIDAGVVDVRNAEEVSRARERARQRVDAHLSRGRKWLRERLAEELEKNPR